MEEKVSNENFLQINHKDLLILDSDLNNAIIEKKIFENHGLSVETTSNLSDALKLLYIHTPKVLLFDLISNELSITHTIRMISKMHENTVILLRTDLSSKEISLAAQNLHVFNVIPKDSRIETLISEIDSAIRIYKENFKKLDYTDQSKDWLKEELEWLLWKEEHTQSSQSTYGKKIIETIVHSIFQGLGVGGLLTLIDIMEIEKESDGEFSKVKTETLESVIKNGESIRIIKEKLDKVVHVFDLTYDKEIIPASELTGIIKTCIKEMKTFASIKDHYIYFDKNTNNEDFYGNKKLIEIAVKELLTNAFKYAPESTTVTLSIMHIENTVSIVITNFILPTPGGISGIPKELEHKIFEPFFKINNIYDDRFFNEDLGFGVGLAVLQKGITNLGGKIHVYETTDYVLEKPVRKIIAALGFPKVTNLTEL